MTIIFRQLYRIIKDGISSLSSDIDGNKTSQKQLVIFFIIVPYFIFGLTYWLEINLDNIIDTLLSVLSIFTALIFGVLFTVPDKLSHRIEKLNQKKDNATQNYLIRFYNFTKKFVQQTSFIIALSIFLIILLIFQKVFKNNAPKLILTAINCSVFYILIMYVLSILANIYILLMDDIKMGKDGSIT